MKFNLFKKELGGLCYVSQAISKPDKIFQKKDKTVFIDIVVRWTPLDKDIPTDLDIFRPFMSKNQCVHADLYLKKDILETFEKNDNLVISVYDFELKEGN